MFGYIMPDFEGLNEEEKKQFQYAYCSLCRVLGYNYGKLGQATLSYDMTFLSILLSSLYDSYETSGEQRCIMHPVKNRPYLYTGMTAYAADMNILLAYYQCLDDWQDDHNLVAFAKMKFLEKFLPRIEENYSRQFNAVRAGLSALGQMEAMNELNPDIPANCFGQILGEIFAPNEDNYTTALRKIGASLGRFVYLVDACIDLKDDIKKERYNPLISQMNTDFELVLTMIISECAEEFEQLSFEKDEAILRNIIYSGIWLKYNINKNKEAS